MRLLGRVIISRLSLPLLLRVLVTGLLRRVAGRRLLRVVGSCLLTRCGFEAVAAIGTVSLGRIVPASGILSVEDAANHLAHALAELRKKLDRVSHTAVAAAAYSRSPAAHTHTQEQAADNWTVAGCIEAAADTPNRSAGSAQRRNRRRSRQRTNSSKRRCASPCEWFECSWFLIVLNFQCSSRRIFAR